MPLSNADFTQFLIDEIDERLKGKARLDTLIHELVHSFDNSLTEEYVTKLATYLADNLYRNRVRVIESD